VQSLLSLMMAWDDAVMCVLSEHVSGDAKMSLIPNRPVMF